MLHQAFIYYEKERKIQKFKDIFKKVKSAKRGQLSSSSIEVRVWVKKIIRKNPFKNRNLIIGSAR